MLAKPNVQKIKVVAPKKKKTSKYLREVLHCPLKSNCYNGPVMIPAAIKADDSYVTELRSLQVLTSTAGGIFSTVLSNAPGGFTDWSSFQNLFSEYRVLAMDIKYFPYNRYSKTSTVCTPLYAVWDRNSATALGSKTAATGYASCKQLSLEDPFEMSLKMDGPDEAQFRDIGTSTATFWWKPYSDNLSISTTYGDILVTVLVQFRGRN